MKPFIIGCVFFFMYFSIFAEEELLEVSDTRKEFTIAIGSVSTTRNSTAGEYIAQKISESLKRDLQTIEHHRYSEVELIRYREHLRSEKIQTNIKELSTAYVQRDKAYLKGDEKSRDTLTAQIIELVEEKEILASENSLDYIVDEEKQVVVKEEISILSEIPDKAYMTEYLLDMFIFIEVASNGEVYAVTISVVDFDGSAAVIAREVGTVEELFDKIGEPLFKLRNRVRGFPAYNIIVRTDPQDSAIFIDDVLSGTGFFSGTLIPGDYSLKAKRSGFSEHNETIKIEDKDSIELDIKLEPLERFRFSIQTIPAEAEVYMDSVPQGKSPLFTSSYDDFHVFQFDMEGYKQQKLIYEPGNPTDILISLEPDYADINDLFEIRRWNFYRSFGAFILSIPVSLFLSGMSAEYQNYGDINEPFDYEYAVSTISLYGSIYLNIVLFAQTIVSLFDYIDVGKQTIRGEFVDTGR